MKQSGSLTLSEVRVCRRGRNILSVDSLKISPGQFVGLIGPNGAGKTTLLKTLCGLIKPDSGLAAMDGKAWNNLSRWKQAKVRKSIGYIPQATEYNADLPFNVREVVAMGRAATKPLLGSLGRDDYKLVDYWIKKLGLDQLTARTFRSLSGGEQQKVLIARAMSQKPAVLMLDEAAVNLDFDWKQQFTDIVEDLYQQLGITVIMVSHEINLLPSCCKRVLVLSRGRLAADGNIEQTLSPDVLGKVYNCRVETAEIGGRIFVTAARK